jgi:hypothetical protein
MRTAWDVLTEAGVPDGAARVPPSVGLDAAAVAAALSSVGADVDRLRPHERECLGAWLAAFRHHWPDRFTAVLGPLGDRVLDRCTAGDLDPNRHLKLRRIATANLARRV